VINIIDLLIFVALFIGILLTVLETKKEYIKKARGKGRTPKQAEADWVRKQGGPKDEDILIHIETSGLKGLGGWIYDVHDYDPRRSQEESRKYFKNRRM